MKIRDSFAEICNLSSKCSRWFRNVVDSMGELLVTESFCLRYSPRSLTSFSRVLSLGVCGFSILEILAHEMRIDWIEVQIRSPNSLDGFVVRVCCKSSYDLMAILQWNSISERNISSRNFSTHINYLIGYLFSDYPAVIYRVLSRRRLDNTASMFLSRTRSI